MAITLNYDKNSQILKVTVVGDLALHDIASTFDKITSSEGYPSNVDTLWDMRQADFESTSTDFWQSLIGIRKQRYPKRKNFRLALVASSDFSFGMLRMYEMLSEPHLDRELMVFKDLSAAEKWILANPTR